MGSILEDPTGRRDLYRRVLHWLTPPLLDIWSKELKWLTKMCFQSSVRHLTDWVWSVTVVDECFSLTSTSLNDCMFCSFLLFHFLWLCSHISLLWWGFVLDSFRLNYNILERRETAMANTNISLWKEDLLSNKTQKRNCFIWNFQLLGLSWKESETSVVSSNSLLLRVRKTDTFDIQWMRNFEWVYEVQT